MDFLINVTPVGKGRPRVSSRGGFARMYTPKKTSDFETLVRNQVIKTMTDNNWQMFGEDIPLIVELYLYFPMSKSLSKKKKIDLKNKYHTKKPDVDNVIKAVLDACNEVVYYDDSQIVTITSVKRYVDDIERDTGLISMRVMQAPEQLSIFESGAENA